jgi:hypothetical protein
MGYNAIINRESGVRSQESGHPPHTQAEFKVGDRVLGEFGRGVICHIHGKKATVEYGAGQKLQIKLCHLQLIEQLPPVEPVLTVELPVETSLTVSTSTRRTDVGEAEEAVLTVNRPASEAVTVSTPAKKPVLTVERKEPEAITVSTRRKRGDGTGRVQWRTITKKNGKQYEQPWYDWQIHQGEKTIYKSKYIPKRLVAKIQELEEEKAPVREILELLGVDR